MRRVGMTIEHCCLNDVDVYSRTLCGADDGSSAVAPLQEVRHLNRRKLLVLCEALSKSRVRLLEVLHLLVGEANARQKVFEVRGQIGHLALLV